MGWKLQVAICRGRGAVIVSSGDGIAVGSGGLVLTALGHERAAVYDASLSE